MSFHERFALGILIALLLLAGSAGAAPFAYITNEMGNSVSVVDTATNTVTATVNVGSYPEGVGVNWAGTRVYVTNVMDKTVSVIDTESNTVIATIPIGGYPKGVAVNPAGTRVYVAYNNLLAVIDADSNTVIATVNTVNVPYGVAVNPAGTRVYAATHGGGPSDGALSVINPETNRVITTINVGRVPYGVVVNPAGTRAYVANHDDSTVSVINTETNSVVATIPVGKFPIGIAVNPAGTRVYVATLLVDSVDVIDTGSNTVTATVRVGRYPYGVAVNPAGTRVYVANDLDSTLSVIDSGTNAVTTTLSVGSRPKAFGQFIPTEIPPPNPPPPPPPPTPVPDTYVITPSAGSGGSISPDTPQTVEDGATPRFTFTPEDLFTVDQILIDEKPEQIPPLISPLAYTFNPVHASHTIHVTFRQNRFIITPSAGAGGSISPSTPQTVKDGDTTDFSFTPDPGFMVDQVFVDGAQQQWTDPWYVFPPVHASHTIRVTFDRNVPALLDTTIGSHWEGYFMDHAPIIKALLLIPQVVANQGAPSAFVWVQLKARLANDGHVHSANADVISDDILSPLDHDPMRKNDDGWYQAEYASGNPAEAFMDFVLEYCIFPILHIEINPVEPISLPSGATWQSVTASDASTFELGHQYNLPVNKNLPTFSDAVWHNRVFGEEFYFEPITMATVWIAPKGSERINVLVTDPQGRRVGTIVSGDTITDFNEIPDALYPPSMTYRDTYTVGIVVIPNPLEGDYQATVYGNEPADFTLQTVQINNGELTQKSTIEGTIVQGGVINYESIIDIQPPETDNQEGTLPVPEFPSAVIPAGTLSALAGVVFLMKKKMIS